MKATLFTEEHREIKSDSLFALQNETLLRARLSAERRIVVRTDAVVATQGSIKFSPLEELSEHHSPYVCGEGEGSVFVASEANHVHLILLEDEGLTVNGLHVLAFNEELKFQAHSKRLPGLEDRHWGVHLFGRGSLAITTRGKPLLLKTIDGKARTDLASTVAWASSLTPKLKESTRFEKEDPRPRAERFYYSFEGDGWIIVQPGK